MDDTVHTTGWIRHVCQATLLTVPPCQYSFLYTLSFHYLTFLIHSFIIPFEELSQN